MCIASTVTPPQDRFLDLLPAIERHARITFRGRPPADREEAAAEAVAAAYASYVRLIGRGKDPARDFPSHLATYAVLHVKAGRQVGGWSSSTDALSPLARRERGFRVEALSTPHASPAHFSTAGDRGRPDEFEDRLRDNTRTAVPDQVAFRIDFPAFLRELAPRDRALIRFLAMGHSAQAAADRFGLSPGRVSQMRRMWREKWRLFQGETPGCQPC
jgi:hypothetical protein